MTVLLCCYFGKPTLTFNLYMRNHWHRHNTWLVILLRLRKPTCWIHIWGKVSDVDKESLCSKVWSLEVCLLCSRECGMYKASDILLGDHLCEKSETISVFQYACHPPTHPLTQLPTHTRVHVSTYTHACARAHTHKHTHTCTHVTAHTLLPHYCLSRDKYPHPNPPWEVSTHLAN